MKLTIAATAIALATIAAPAFAQPSNSAFDSRVQEIFQEIRAENEHIVVKETTNLFRTDNTHSHRAQHIFDEIRAERGHFVKPGENGFSIADNLRVQKIFEDIAAE